MLSFLSLLLSETESQNVRAEIRDKLVDSGSDTVLLIDQPLGQGYPDSLHPVRSSGVME